jgi:heptaprenyl diphosphate synthase
MREIAEPGNRRLDTVAFMGALCLFFSTLEYLIPKPFPFFRLGLANLPVLLALTFFSPRDVLLLVVLKVVGQGLVNGTLASYVFLFSAAGSIASAGVMLAVYQAGKRAVSLVGVSLFGALASNAVQVTLSVTFIFGQTAWVIAPLFLGIGVASGFVVGLVAERFSEKSSWLSVMKGRYRGA